MTRIIAPGVAKRTARPSRDSGRKDEDDTTDTPRSFSLLVSVASVRPSTRTHDRAPHDLTVRVEDGWGHPLADSKSEWVQTATSGPAAAQDDGDSQTDSQSSPMWEVTEELARTQLSLSEPAASGSGCSDTEAVTLVVIESSHHGQRVPSGYDPPPRTGHSGRRRGSTGLEQDQLR